MHADPVKFGLGARPGGALVARVKLVRARVRVRVRARVRARARVRVRVSVSDRALGEHGLSRSADRYGARVRTARSVTSQ